MEEQIAKARARKLGEPLCGRGNDGVHAERITSSLVLCSKNKAVAVTMSRGRRIEIHCARRSACCIRIATSSINRLRHELHIAQYFVSLCTSALSQAKRIREVPSYIYLMRPAQDGRR